MLSLPVPASVSISSGTSMSFTVDASSGVAGSVRTVCVEVLSSAGFMMVGSAGSLQLVSGVSVSPTGLAVSMISTSTLLTVSGSALSVADSVVLVATNSAGTVSCSSAAGATVGSNGVFGTTSSSSNGATLVVSIVSPLPNAGMYLVCMQFGGQGPWLGLTGSAAAIQFSAVSLWSISPTVYQLSGLAQLLTVQGTGLSTFDSYYAVSASGSCNAVGDVISGITLSGVSMVSFGTVYTVAATFSVPTVGMSFIVCIRPGNNNNVAVAAVAVGNSGSGTIISAVTLSGTSGFTPTVVPTLSSGTVMLTVNGSGFPSTDAVKIVSGVCDSSNVAGALVVNGASTAVVNVFCSNTATVFLVRVDLEVCVYRLLHLGRLCRWVV